MGRRVCGSASKRNRFARSPAINQTEMIFLKKSGNDIQLITSTITIVEVAWGKAEQDGKLLSADRPVSVQTVNHDHMTLIRMLNVARSPQFGLISNNVDAAIWLSAQSQNIPDSADRRGEEVAAAGWRYPLCGCSHGPAWLTGV